MRQTTFKFVSVGLLLGLIIGCGKAGPNGLQGLCEKVVDCLGQGSADDCVSQFSSCGDLDAAADDCLAMDECGAIVGCYVSLGLNCMPSTTMTDPTVGTTAEPDTAGETVDPTTAGPSGDPTADPSGDPTADPSTDPTATTTVDPSGTTTVDPSETTGAGGLYGVCDAMGMCPGGQMCFGVMGVEGNFCSPPCEGMGCPAFDGTGQPQCALVAEGEMDPSNCVVVCMTTDNCPAGMTCKEVPDVGVSVCTAP